MKIVLIGGYTSYETRCHLKLKSNKGWFSYLIKFLGLPPRVGEFRDTTPWIGNMAYRLGQINDIELHVVAPHIRMKQKIQDFIMDGVHYHYYSTEWTSFLRMVRNYKIWKRLQTNGKRVKKIIDSINPDIVVLSGTENPISAVSVLYTQKYPTFILCQTIYRNPNRKLIQGKINQLIWDLEEEIHHIHKYFGVYCDMHYDILSKLANNAYIFDFQYPTRPFPIIEDVPLKYDFINFAFQLSEKKGVFDTIKALAIVKKDYPQVTLNLSGGCDEITKSKLTTLINQLGLNENVTFTPFFERRVDLFKHIKSARFAVLPIKLDNISATVKQAMYYGLPVVTNERPGTLDVNKTCNCLLLSESGNIEMLALKMNTLMSNAELADQMRTNASDYFKAKRNEKDNAANRLIQDFTAIISNYKKGAPIPKNLLYSHTNK